MCNPCRRRLSLVRGPAADRAKIEAADGDDAEDFRPADPRIAEAIKKVSPDRIRQTIEKLVSFGNRSTISPQDEESVKAGKGVGAAREWIKSEFERYSKDCGGCLEVKTDAFIEQPRTASGTHANHQCLCGTARLRSGAGQSHRARHRPLRLAQ